MALKKDQITLVRSQAPTGNASCECVPSPEALNESTQDIEFNKRAIQLSVPVRAKGNRDFKLQTS